MGGFASPVRRFNTGPVPASRVPAAAAGGPVNSFGAPPPSRTSSIAAGGPTNMFKPGGAVTPREGVPPVAATGATTTATTTNDAAPDSDLSSMIDAYKKRLKALGDRPAVDQSYTQRAISNARGAIMGGAAGSQEGLSARLAAMGRTGGGGETGMRNRIAEAATRASNKAASDISLQRQRDEEQQAFARDQMENSFLLGGEGIMSAPSKLALSQQGLGLQQMLGMGNLDMQKANQAWNEKMGASQLSLEQQRLEQSKNQDQFGNFLALSRMYPDMAGGPVAPSYGGNYAKPGYTQPGRRGNLGMG